MDPARVVVVVLNWNGREDTLSCLHSLEDVTYENMEVLVVDNGSVDGSEEAIREAYPGLELRQTGRNLGFAGGNNVGLRWALEHDADYVLLLNNDTVVDPGFLSAMVERAESDPHHGVVGAAISYFDQPDRLWAYGGGRFDVATGWVRHVVVPTPDEELRTRGTVHFYVTGCTLLIRRSLLESIGLLDTGYFHFSEDVDFCLRAERAGYRSVVAPDARLRHKVSATTKVGSPVFLYYNLRSRLRVISRFGPPDRPRLISYWILWLRLWRPAVQSGMPIAGWRALWRAKRDFENGVEGPAPVDVGGPPGEPSRI